MTDLHRSLEGAPPRWTITPLTEEELRIRSALLTERFGNSVTPPSRLQLARVPADGRFRLLIFDEGAMMLEGEDECITVLIEVIPSDTGNRHNVRFFKLRGAPDLRSLGESYKPREWSIENAVFLYQKWRDDRQQAVSDARARAEKDARFAEQQRQYDERRERERPWRALYNLSHRFLSFVPATVVPWRDVRATPDDVDLAILWSGPNRCAILRREWERHDRDVARFRIACKNIVQLPSEVQSAFAGMLTARLAEHAARTIYQHFHGELVRDIAGEQAAAIRAVSSRGGNPCVPGTVPRGDYSYADFSIEHDSKARFYDVKSSRQPFLPRDEWEQARAVGRRPWSFSQQLARPKDPPTSSNVKGTVAYVGVLCQRVFRAVEVLDVPAGDPWIPGADRAAHFEVLGEVTRQKLLDLQAHVHLVSGLKLNFWQTRLPGDPSPDRRRMGEGSRLLELPPWVYDLPDQAYADRDHQLDEAERLFRTTGQAPAFPANQFSMAWPLFLASQNLDDLPLQSAISSTWRRFLEMILALPGERRRSLPFLYATVLGHFLDSVRAGEMDGFSVAPYRLFLFGDVGLEERGARVRRAPDLAQPARSQRPPPDPSPSYRNPSDPPRGGVPPA